MQCRDKGFGLRVIKIFGSAKKARRWVQIWVPLIPGSPQLEDPSNFCLKGSDGRVFP